MTIAELLKEEDGNYTAWETWKLRKADNNEPFNSENLVCVPDNSNVDSTVLVYELMTQEDYNQTVMANQVDFIDFGEEYDDKDAVILVIGVK